LAEAVIDNLVLWGLAGWFGFNLLVGLWFCLLYWRTPDERFTPEEHKMLDGDISAEDYFAYLEQFEDAK
jgi:hypothetical protein